MPGTDGFRTPKTRQCSDDCFNLENINDKIDPDRHWPERIARLFDNG